MEEVTPQVFLIGETRIHEPGLKRYLEHVGVPDWDSDAPSDAEKLVEVMGRLCYRSFEPGLNPNVTKIRQSNADYIGNIIRVKHGSVIEHPMVNFIFTDVSRVFTHELVRHRPGVAISQESLRFVRLDKLDPWVPSVIRESPEALEIFTKTFRQLEELQLSLAELYELDEPGKKFAEKKEVTSAMRRLAPIGVSTNIGWSANIRTIRWLLEARTHPSAEEEIRLVFGKVGELVLERYPNLFGDFDMEIVDGHPHFVPESSKV